MKQNISKRVCSPSALATSNTSGGTVYNCRLLLGCESSQRNSGALFCSHSSSVASSNSWSEDSSSSSASTWVSENSTSEASKRPSASSWALPTRSAGDRSSGSVPSASRTRRSSTGASSLVSSKNLYQTISHTIVSSSLLLEPRRGAKVTAGFPRLLPMLAIFWWKGPALKRVCAVSTCCAAMVPLRSAST